MNRDYLNEAKKEKPDLTINCWWCTKFLYREYIKPENFSDYLKALDCPINAITTDYPLIVK